MELKEADFKWIFELKVLLSFQTYLPVNLIVLFYPSLLNGCLSLKKKNLSNKKIEHKKIQKIEPQNILKMTLTTQKVKSNTSAVYCKQCLGVIKMG